jgi:hypothetical protein
LTALLAEFNEHVGHGAWLPGAPLAVSDGSGGKIPSLSVYSKQPHQLATSSKEQAMRRAICAVAICLAPFSVATRVTAQCGGTERWAVKVGSDPGAATINLTSPVNTTVNSLVSLVTPTLPPHSDNSTRTAQERTVRSVQARLVKFKPELGKSGDDDFHLVMSDSTLQFSQGKNVSPHSFVAEIVNPGCVPGKKGAAGTTSQFQSQIDAVWKAFNARFPNVKHGWNDGGGMPVRVTGIGFFDREHGQTGRAKNQIEIHPVLEIDFMDAPGVPTTAANLVVNPGLESGSTSWTVDGEAVISSDQREPAKSGSMKAWLGGHGEAGTERLSQRVEIPNATTVTLSFQLHITTEEQGTQPLDTLAIEVRSTNGQLLRTIKTFSNLQANDGYQMQTLDLSEFKNRTVRIQFVAREDQGSFTSFVIDDITVRVG